MKWLVTAFEPFENAKSNSSSLVVDELKKLDWQDKVVFSSPLPVTFADHWPYLERALKEHSDVEGVLALGQTSRPLIAIERVALNWMDARVPDNKGEQPEDTPIGSGPDMYWSPIPWRQFTLPEHCEFSYSAGTFVCNAVMYRICEWAKAKNKLAGFVHIPVLESQTDEQYLSRQRMPQTQAVSVLRKMLEFLVDL